MTHVTCFSFTPAFGTIDSHAMFLQDNVYVHVWGAETAAPVVKVNVPNTRQQKRVTGKKAVQNAVAVVLANINA